MRGFKNSLGATDKEHPGFVFKDCTEFLSIQNTAPEISAPAPAMSTEHFCKSDASFLWTFFKNYLAFYDCCGKTQGRAWFYRAVPSSHQDSHLCTASFLRGISVLATCNALQTSCSSIPSTNFYTLHEENNSIKDLLKEA